MWVTITDIGQHNITLKAPTGTHLWSTCYSGPWTRFWVTGPAGAQTYFPYHKEAGNGNGCQLMLPQPLLVSDEIETLTLKCDAAPPYLLYD